ncbi:MAG: hypothetical protein IT359_13725 [Gemmatimonadaceae bacterium]|nr:hypothetical protein [Gemmatimonadaceae bacterium]
MNDLLRGVLTIDPGVWESDDQRLVRSISERVDVASGDDTRLLTLARDVRSLLDEASSNEAVELLLELIAERERVLGIIRKYAQGEITRTSFLSFVAEQRWPESVRHRMSALSAAGVMSLATALEAGDITQIEASLIP